MSAKTLRYFFPTTPKIADCDRYIKERVRLLLASRHYRIAEDGETLEKYADDPYVVQKFNWKPVLFPHEKRIQTFWKMHVTAGLLLVVVLLACSIENRSSRTRST